ncbi:MAG TPA: hypothetical protein VKG82_10280 [Solirubrobacteraceae bacterium]|nr:hypothetical protein [Solirubrobacteraceae bacterium]
MNGRQVHHAGTLVLSLFMVLIGLALVAQVVGGHVSTPAGRLIAAALFIAAGGGRIYAEKRRKRGV